MARVAAAAPGMRALLDPGSPRVTADRWPPPADAPPPVAIPARFAARLERVWAVPHAYTHFVFARTRDGIVGEGASQDPGQAWTTAICEAMERDLARCWRPDELRRAARRDLDGAVCDPAECVLPSAAERAVDDRFVPYRPDRPLSWLRGVEIVGDGLRPAWLPASLTVLRFGWAHPAERIAPCLSAGAAAGPTLVEAALHGLYERVERDAFVIAWLNRLICPRWVVTGLPEPAADAALRRLRRDGFTVDFVDLTTDLGVPVVMCAIRPADEWWSHAPRVAFGLGARLDRQQAVARAFSEALELMINHFDFDDPRQIGVRDTYQPPPGVDLDAYYGACREWLTGDLRAADAIDRVAASASSPREALAAVVARLAEHDVRVFFADLTPMDVRRHAFRLARVVTTRLQPHVYDRRVRRLGGRRLFEAPMAMGHRARPSAAEALASAPDPYTLLESGRTR